MAMNIQQLFQQYPELSNPENWKKVTPKAYKAYLTILPVPVKVRNAALSAQFEVPALQAIVCRPYKDIRKAVNLDYYKDSEGRTGQALVNAHAKKHCINGGHEPQSVLPWTPVTYIEPVNAPIKVAIRLDIRKIHNTQIKTAQTDVQFYGQVVMANNSLATIKNGLGDYLVADAILGPNGTYLPNMNTIDVINGRTFTEMFDMRAFAGQNVATDGDAFVKPVELVEFTSVVKKSAHSLIVDFARQNNLKLSFSEEDADLLNNLGLPVDDNNIPLLNEEQELKALRRAVTVNFTSKDCDTKLRIVLKTQGAIKHLLRKAVKNATLFSKTAINNVANGSEYVNITNILAELS